MKKINLEANVCELCEAYPELIDILYSLGFSEIKNEVMRKSVGRIMTLPKASKLKKIDLQKIISVLEENSFSLVGESLDTESPEAEAGAEENFTEGNADKGNVFEPVLPSDIKLDIPAESEKSDDKNNRVAKLQDFLSRLGQGEDLEAVRKDFVTEFKDVGAEEIMESEQNLIKSGTKVEEIQKLCDLHSALFHGMTQEEKLAEVKHSIYLSKMKQEDLRKKGDKKELYACLSSINGHPLQTFKKENEAVSQILDSIENAKNSAELFSTLKCLLDISVHYAKKGDLLYPLLKNRYQIIGPAEVMWTVDDEIRDELRKSYKELKNTKEVNVSELVSSLNPLLTRIREMIYKENNILFPIVALNFTDDEWVGIYEDSKKYEACFAIDNKQWLFAERKSADSVPVSPRSDVAVNFTYGKLNAAQLEAMLDTLPMEITFVDHNDINAYYNDSDGLKFFKRPKMSLGRDVYSCHPPKIEPMVRKIISDFKEGKSDCVSVPIRSENKNILVRYMALRDKNRKYLGTMEIVLNFDELK